MHPRLWLVVALLAAALPIGACSARSSTTAPGYEVRDRQDRPVRIDDLSGAPVLITSWATWCRECKTLLPALERFHRQQAQHGVQVVAVNVNAPGSESEVEELERQYGMSMPRWRDVDNDFTQVFRSRGVPTSVLLDEDGLVVRRWPGGIPLDDAGTGRLLRRLLAEDR